MCGGGEVVYERPLITSSVRIITAPELTVRLHARSGRSVCVSVVSVLVCAYFWRQMVELARRHTPHRCDWTLCGAAVGRRFHLCFAKRWAGVRQTSLKEMLI